MVSRLVIALAAALALAGCAAGTGPGGATTALGEPSRALTIDGSLAYRERIALPPDSTAIVELREASSADGRVVAESRAPLEGRQVPIPFKLVVDRARLAAGARYQFSGAIVSGGRPIWATEPVEIDAASRAIELGELRLARYEALASATTLQCGDQAVTASHVGDTLRLTIGSEAFTLRQVAAASGARYEANGDPSTSFWSKGERATLVVRGRRYPECTTAPGAAMPFRATGNEPGWRLDLGDTSMSLLMDNGRTRIEAPTPVPESGPESRRYRASAAGRPLTVTVFDRRCADTMTGMPHPNAVVVEFGGRTLEGCGGDPGALLRGGEWVVEDLRGGGIVDRSRVTLNFGADGRVGGAASCNRYTAAYALTGEGLAISKAAATMMACAPSLMQQERQFLDLLGQVRWFSIDDSGALLLHAGDGRTVRARRVPG